MSRLKSLEENLPQRARSSQRQVRYSADVYDFEILSSRTTLTVSPTFLPIASRISAFMGSLCVPLPSAMKELRNSWPSTLPRTLTRPRVPKNSADSGQITKVQPPFFGLFCSLAVNDFFSGAMTRSVYRDLRALGGGAEFGEPRCESVRQGVEAARGSGVFALRGNGLAGIATDADARIDFNFTENRNAIGDCRLCAFAVAEDVDGLIAVRADE